jgi:hypothetical protein
MQGHDPAEKSRKQQRWLLHSARHLEGPDVALQSAIPSQTSKYGEQKKTVSAGTKA